MSRHRPTRALLRAWLQAPGALTARLAAAWGGFSVTLLAQRRERPWPHERRALGLAPHVAVLVRQVLLMGPAGECVQARSLCALRAVRGPWRALRGLGGQPLATLLYARPGIRRSALQARWLAARSPERRALGRSAGAADAHARGLWQRWSVFTRQGQRLLVAEHFRAAWPHRSAAPRRR